MIKLHTLLIFCLSLLLSGCHEAPAFKSTDITGADWGKDFALTDHQGKARRLGDFKGKVVLLFFGYTQCPDVCPTTLASMRDVLQQLGESAGDVQVVFVTLDPLRDTPPVLAEYVRAFHPGFIGLYGDEARTAATARDFKVFYVKHPGTQPGSYSIDHSTGSYAFDRQGRLRLLIRHGEAIDNVAADLRRLLAGR